MVQNPEVQRAVDRLWKVIPIGYGADFNLVLRELERRETMLDNYPE